MTTVWLTTYVKWLSPVNSCYTLLDISAAKKLLVSQYSDSLDECSLKAEKRQHSVRAVHEAEVHGIIGILNMLDQTGVLGSIGYVAMCRKLLAPLVSLLPLMSARLILWTMLMLLMSIDHGTLLSSGLRRTELWHLAAICNACLEVAYWTRCSCWWRILSWQVQQLEKWPILVKLGSTWDRRLVLTASHKLNSEELFCGKSLYDRMKLVCLSVVILWILPKFVSVQWIKDILGKLTKANCKTNGRELVAKLQADIVLGQSSWQSFNEVMCCVTWSHLHFVISTDMQGHRQSWWAPVLVLFVSPQPLL